MRRSEMLAQISDNILISFFSNMDLQTRMLIADCVLSECEKMGMEPPPYSIDQGWKSGWEDETE